MKIHEYQAKEILRLHGIPVPEGSVAFSPEEAFNIASKLGGRVVIKAQIHAGGRGKAGGVKVVSSAKEAQSTTSSLIGTNLVTSQTDLSGVPVEKVLVEEVLDIEKELYLAMLIDGASKSITVVASKLGGTEIEEVSANAPHELINTTINPILGIQQYQIRKIAYEFDIPASLLRTMISLVSNLYKVFEANDCSLVEINPLVITKDQRILAADAKLTLDDDALFKHSGIQELQDTKQADPLEIEAQNHGISYVKLDGSVGCIVNGAGLAMATMDVIKSTSASPANFLDVGGSADDERVANALNIVFSDKDVDRILINIFGGILRCDTVARGILLATNKSTKLIPPMVIRMQGTNAEEGRSLLSDSGLNVTLVNDLNEAANAIASLA